MELAAVEPRAPQAAATMGALDRPEAGEKVGHPAPELQSDAQLSRTEHGPDTEAASHLAVALGAELVGAAEADTAAGRRVEATEAEHRGALAASGQDAVAIAAEGVRQFAALQSRIETLQASLDANQIEPVRREMLSSCGNCRMWAATAARSRARWPTCAPSLTTWRSSSTPPAT